MIVGFPTAGRSSFESAGTVGYFVNMLALRADLSQNPSFDLFLYRVRQRVLEALEHEAYPFALLVERPIDPESIAMKDLSPTTGAESNCGDSAGWRRVDSAADLRVLTATLRLRYVAAASILQTRWIS